MKYPWVVKSTGRPFGPTEPLGPDDYRYTDSKHTSLNAARQACRAEYAEMKRICGQNAWSDHFRVFAKQDTVMKAEVQCNVCDALWTRKYTWLADMPEPTFVDDECPACQQRRRNMTEVQSYEDFAAHRRAAGDSAYYDREDD